MRRFSFLYGIKGKSHSALIHSGVQYHCNKNKEGDSLVQLFISLIVPLCRLYMSMSIYYTMTLAKTCHVLG